MSGGIGKLIGLVMSLIVGLFVLWAVSQALNPVYNAVPEPAGSAISTYSTYQDAAEMGAIVVNIVVVTGGLVGVAVSKEPRLLLGVVGVLFLIFLATGL